MNGNFDAVFGKKPEPLFIKEQLAYASPCRDCMYRLKNTDHICYSDECDSCMKKYEWLISCLDKLAWYEEKEKKL